MGQLKYHNGTTWVSIEQTTADYTALVFNDPVTGTANGVNAVFNTTRNFSSVSVYVNGQKQNPGALNDYTVTGANQITFTATSVPPSGAVVTADFSTSASFTATGTNSFVVKQAVTGLVNGSNTSYTTASGYIGGTLEVYVNGLRQGISHVTETNPGAGTFSLDKAPSTGDVVEVGYMMAGIPSGNADTVDGVHASQTATANTIPVLDSNKVLGANSIGSTLVVAENTAALTGTWNTKTRWTSGTWNQYGLFARDSQKHTIRIIVPTGKKYTIQLNHVCSTVQSPNTFWSMSGIAKMSSDETSMTFLTQSLNANGDNYHPQNTSCVQVLTAGTHLFSVYVRTNGATASTWHGGGDGTNTTDGFAFGRSVVFDAILLNVEDV